MSEGGPRARVPRGRRGDGGLEAGRAVRRCGRWRPPVRSVAQQRGGRPGQPTAKTTRSRAGPRLSRTARPRRGSSSLRRSRVTYCGLVFGDMTVGARVSRVEGFARISCTPAAGSAAGVRRGPWRLVRRTGRSGRRARRRRAEPRPVGWGIGGGRNHRIKRLRGGLRVGARVQGTRVALGHGAEPGQNDLAGAGDERLVVRRENALALAAGYVGGREGGGGGVGASRRSALPSPAKRTAGIPR